MPTTVTIDHLGQAGDGVCHWQGQNHYLPGVLPGEVVALDEAGRVQAVIEPSPDRQSPPCPHFGICGGCQLQHMTPAAYEAWQVQRLGQILERAGVKVTEMAPLVTMPPHSRRRISVHVRWLKGKAIVGFKQRKSWSVVDVRACEIAHPDVVAALPGIVDLAGPLAQIPKAAPTCHLTRTETGLDVHITGVPPRYDARLRAQVTSAAVAMDLARLSVGKEIWIETRAPQVRFGDVLVTPPPGGFLQAVPEAEAAMAQAVQNAGKHAETVMDLFCGAGAFALRLARDHAVEAYEMNAEAITALQTAARRQQGLKPVQAKARDLFRMPLSAKELNRAQAVVLNPPRAGAEAQVAQLAASEVQTIAYVSCNPQTFARDAKVLQQAGYRLCRLQPIDQFLWSPHVEIVGILEKLST